MVVWNSVDFVLDPDRIQGGSRDDRLFFPIKALSVNGYLVRTFPRPEDEVDRDRDVQRSYRISRDPPGSESGCGLLGTCRLRRGVDPGHYLRHVLNVIADWPVNRVSELLPWRVALPLNNLSPLSIRPSLDAYADHFKHTSWLANMESGVNTKYSIINDFQKFIMRWYPLVSLILV